MDTKVITPFGAEVIVDRCDTIMRLGPKQKAELVRLYERDGLLLLRNLDLTVAEQTTLCEIFGPVTPQDKPVVSNVRPDGILGDSELRFHHDIPYVAFPYLGAALHALDVDDGVSPTRYASGYLAFERLPEPLRRRVGGLNAIHVRGRTEDRRTKLTDVLPGDTSTVHPVVGHHPVTGRAYLFVDESMTAAIIGMDDRDSDELLAELFSYLYDDENIYEHVWRNGDLVLWDNRAIQHGRRAIAAEGSRTLQRVSIATFSYYQQCPTDFANSEDLLTATGGRGWSSQTPDNVAKPSARSTM